MRHLVTEKPQHVGGDVRILVVEAVRAAIEAKAVALLGDAVASDRGGRFEDPERIPHSARIEAGGEAGGTAAQNGQHESVDPVSAGLYPARSAVLAEVRAWR